MRGKIEVIIKGGTPEERGLALQGLLETVNDKELRQALEGLSTQRLKRVAQSVHGRLYNRLIAD